LISHSRACPVQLSKSFDVDYNQVSGIPTLVQAGYAVGLLLISPLGDLVRRRPLMLVLILLTTALSIGLAVTPSLAVFEGLSFLVGVFSVVPQILIPLAADLAPPHKRGAAISLVLAGLLCGILYARVIGGVIAEFASWRVVYYVAIGIQAVVLLGMYAILPDYPAKNPDLTYFTILFTMAKLAVTEPTLIQACLISIGSAACFSAFWVTLTFLLGGEPYHYSTCVCMRRPVRPRSQPVFDPGWASACSASSASRASRSRRSRAGSSTASCRGTRRLSASSGTCSRRRSRSARAASTSRRWSSRASASTSSGRWRRSASRARCTGSTRRRARG
jgi:MFS family permease